MKRGANKQFAAQQDDEGLRISPLASSLEV